MAVLPYLKKKSLAFLLDLYLYFPNILCTFSTSLSPQGPMLHYNTLPSNGGMVKRDDGLPGSDGGVFGE
jgi:hypothetical protein